MTNAEELEDQEILKAKKEGYNAGRQFLKNSISLCNPYSYTDNRVLNLSWYQGYRLALESLLMALKLKNNVWLIPKGHYVRLEELDLSLGVAYVTFMNDSFKSHYPYSISDIQLSKDSTF